MNGDPVRTGRFDRARWSAAVGLTAAASTILVIGLLAGQTTAYAAESPVGLGTAESYSVLGGQAVTNTGNTTLGGDLGVSPGTAVTGFPPGLAAGATHQGDAVAAQAQSDVVVAYDDAAGRALTASVAGDLVGQTLPGGVYKSTGPLAVSGTLTLDGQGDPTSVFIFQVASTLITASASEISLVNGAQACNVYWQVGSSATLGTGSSFVGTILALTSISVTTGTVVEGRALARNGQVSLDTNVFTVPGCDTTPITTTTTTESTTTTDESTTTTEPTTTTGESTTTTDESTTTTTPTTTTESSTTTDESTTTTDESTTTTDESTTTTTPTTSTTTDESTSTTTPTTTTESSTTTTPTTTEESSTTTTTTGSTTTGSTTTDTTTTTAPTGTTDSSAKESTSAEVTTTTTSTEAVAADTRGPAEGESIRTGGPGPGGYPSGVSDLASTGVSSGLGPVLAIGVLFLVGGVLLLVTIRSRRSRNP